MMTLNGLDLKRAYANIRGGVDTLEEWIETEYTAACDQQETLERITAERDTLLAACNKTLEYLSTVEQPPLIGNARRTLRAAIAQVRP
jgi:hypothetical protein